MHREPSISWILKLGLSASLLDENGWCFSVELLLVVDGRKE
jgi:hypothetical protein